MKIRLDCSIPMRDGVALSGDVYAPRLDVPHPVLLCRTAYDKQNARYIDWAERFVAAGYAVMMQDCRGRYASDGVWDAYFCEEDDGHDSVEWLAKQPWCNGTVGMFGISYVGFTQTAAALGGSPALQAIMPLASQEDNYGHIWIDGVLQLQNTVNFAKIGRRAMHTESVSRIDLTELYRRLPVRDALDDMAPPGPFREFLEHPSFDGYWQRQSLKGRYDQIMTPACFLTGWYDNLVHEQFKLFTGLRTSGGTREARERTRLIVGPWAHSALGARELAGVDFGPDAQVDIPQEHITWFDSQLGPDAHGAAPAPLRIFIMGANEWRDENEWPLERTVWRQAFLAGGAGPSNRDDGGRLGWGEPPSDVASDEFVYDPEDPVPTLGGQSMFIQNNGPRDRSEVERRDDVLVFSSERLDDDLEVTGPVRLIAYVASDAPDTDFTATLVDVHPSGAALSVCEGITRARYRDSVEYPAMLEPGSVYRIEISLWETAHLFKAGHRIRLEISSSNFPRFDRNLNTGGKIGAESHGRPARQQVFSGSQYPSHLILPTIPA